MKRFLVVLLFCLPVFAEEMTYQIKVEGMTCGGCENMVEDAIKKLPGAHNIHADHKKGMATFLIEETNPVDLQVVKSEIESKGYKVKNVEKISK